MNIRLISAAVVASVALAGCASTSPGYSSNGGGYNRGGGGYRDNY